MKLGKRWIEQIAPSDEPDAWVPVVNEIPSGSSCTYRLDKATGQLKLARVLPRDAAYPTNHGFVPQTRCGADDEEIDVLVLSREPLLPLAIVRAHVIGGFVARTGDQAEPEDQLLATAIDDPSVADVRSIDDLGELRGRIEAFVRTSRVDPDVQVSFERWLDRDTALDRLRRGFRRAKKRPAK
jgi:inorganic pyrophosphatase